MFQITFGVHAPLWHDELTVQWSASDLCINLQESPEHFPLFAEDWLAGFFRQIFAVFVNVDAPQTRMEAASDNEAANDTSFLVSYDCMFK